MVEEPTAAGQAGQLQLPITAAQPGQSADAAVVAGLAAELRQAGAEVETMADLHVFLAAYPQEQRQHVLSSLSAIGASELGAERWRRFYGDAKPNASPAALIKALVKSKGVLRFVKDHARLQDATGNRGVPGDSQGPQLATDTEAGSSSGGGLPAAAARAASKFVGITWRERTQSWQVYVRTSSSERNSSNNHHYIGAFDTAVHAARAYDVALLWLQGHDAGPHTRLNFRLSDYYLEEMQLNNPLNQCRVHWNHNLRPDTRKATWTEEGDCALIFAHQRLGNCWLAIVRLGIGALEGRTKNDLKNHWHNTLKRKDNANSPPSVLRSYIASKGLLPQGATQSQIQHCQQVMATYLSLSAEVAAAAATAAAAVPDGGDDVNQPDQMEGVEGSEGLDPAVAAAMMPPTGALQALQARARSGCQQRQQSQQAAAADGQGGTCQQQPGHPAALQEGLMLQHLSTLQQGQQAAAADGQGGTSQQPPAGAQQAIQSQIQQQLLGQQQQQAALLGHQQQQPSQLELKVAQHALAKQQAALMGHQQQQQTALQRQIQQLHSQQVMAAYLSHNSTRQQPQQPQADGAAAQFDDHWGAAATAVGWGYEQTAMMPRAGALQALARSARRTADAAPKQQQEDPRPTKRPRSSQEGVVMSQQRPGSQQTLSQQQPEQQPAAGGVPWLTSPPAAAVGLSFSAGGPLCGSHAAVGTGAVANAAGASAAATGTVAQQRARVLSLLGI